MDEIVPRTEPSKMDQLYDTLSQSTLLTSITSLFTRQSDSNMNVSIFQKLIDCNSQLEKLYGEKQKQQTMLDKAIQETEQKQAIYDTNLRLVNEKVETMKTHMCSIVDEIATLRASMDTSDHAKIVDLCGDIIHKSGELRKPLGVPVEEFFKHVDLQDMKINTDYHKVVQMNNTLLPKIEESKAREEPYRKRLATIDQEIKSLLQEIHLVKKFQKEHSKIVAQKQLENTKEEEHEIVK